jgi:hypothetical protein
MAWGNGSTIVVNYNDSRTAPSCYAGISYSTNNGATFMRSNVLCSGHGTNFGDPIVVYNARLATWFAGDLATGCGGQGIGLWTSPDGVTWSVGACAHNGSNDDRESMWVDNNPASPFYGRMYIAWNDFAVANARIFVTYSDNGTSWVVPVAVGPTSPFVRQGQVTGSPNGDGAVFVSGHTEGTTDTTFMFRSTNGGVNWTQITVNAYSPAGSTGVVNCGSFRAVPPIWRAPEWGQPAVSGQIAGQNIVHYAYAAAGAGGDIGDVYYVRSTNNGSTWGAPMKMNTDLTTQPQWQPSLSASASGAVMVTWYDRRNTTNGTNYQYWGRASTDNGATWLADDTVSDVLITQPSQPDPNVQACYAGDYNYQSMNGNTALISWTDGRGAGNTQDVEFDKNTVGVNTPTPTRTITATPTRTNTPTPTRTPTLTPTNTIVPATPILDGHVNWQGPPAQPNDLQQLPITLTLKMGTTERNYPSQNTNANGHFTSAVTSLPNGTYLWRVKGPKYLANCGTVVLTGALITTQEMGLMRVGDCDNNNVINVQDFNILKNTFGQAIGDPGYDDRANFNGDGAVNVVDFNLQRPNFGTAGCSAILSPPGSP